LIASGWMMVVGAARSAVVWVSCREGADFD
jgi:hypothetical protein